MSRQSTAVVSAPATEPVSTAEAKLHLKMDDVTADDSLIAALVTAAREYIEGATARALVTQTLRTKIDGFPASDDAIRLPRAPVQSVSSVTYLDSDGATQTMSASDYVALLDLEPAEVALAADASWPTTSEQRGAVTVTYVAGYGAAGVVPQAIKQAILLLVGHWYANREAVAPGQGVSEIPMGAQALISMYAVRSV